MGTRIRRANTQWDSSGVITPDPGAQVYNAQSILYGLDANGLVLADASITSGSPILAVTSGGLDAALHTGMSVQVPKAGASDTLSTPGARTLVTTILHVDSPTQATLATVALNTASHVRAYIGSDQRASAQAAVDAAWSGGGGIVDLGEGVMHFASAMTPRSNVTVKGRGPGQTIVFGKYGVTPFILQGVDNSWVEDLTVEGFGQDGGPGGDEFQSCIQIGATNNSTMQRDCGVRNVECAYAHTGVTLRSQNTYRPQLIDVRAHDMFTSNGTYDANAGSGICIWIFNGVQNPTLINCKAYNSDRHGIFFDPGTTSLTAPTQHGYIDNAFVIGCETYNTNRSGIGVAVGLAGTRSPVVVGLKVGPNGISGIDGTTVLGACHGLYLGGDQNGEYPQHALVSGVSFKDISGIPLDFGGQYCDVRGVHIDNFNTSQSVSVVAPIYFRSYTGYTASNLLAGPDVIGNRVDGVTIIYRGADATKYTHVADFIGNTSVPDGASGTRNQSTLGNRVSNVNIISKPNTGMAAYSPGSNAATCPSEGPNANFVGQMSVVDQPGGFTQMIAAFSEAFSRFRASGNGKMEWGGGSATFDTNLYRASAGKLMTDYHLAATNGLSTYTKAGAISDADFGGFTPPNGMIGIDTTNGRIYFRYGNAWHYCAQDA